MPLVCPLLVLFFFGSLSIASIRAFVGKKKLDVMKTCLD